MNVYTKGMTSFPNINEEILNFINNPFSVPKFSGLSTPMVNKEFSSRGFNLPRQCGKTTAIHKIFTDSIAIKNVILFTDMSVNKRNLIDSLVPEFRDYASKRIFTRTSDPVDTAEIFGAVQRENLILLDGFSVRGFFASIRKLDYDFKFKLLAMDS